MSAMRIAIEELIYRSCLLLDDKDFEGYLDLCHHAYRYDVRAYSPELRKDMLWMDLDKAGLTALFRTLPRHNSDPAPLSRHANVFTVAIDDAAAQAQVVSGLQVFRTELDGGATALFAVGRLLDTVALDGDGPRLLARTIRLDTRRLGIGSHIPF